MFSGQGKQSLKKRVTANFDKEKRGDGDSNGSPPRGHSQQKMGVFASSSALTMLEKASKMYSRDVFAMHADKIFD